MPRLPRKMHKTCPPDPCDLGLCADEKVGGTLSPSVQEDPELKARVRLLEDGNLNEMDLANSLGLQDASLQLGAASASQNFCELSSSAPAASSKAPDLCRSAASACRASRAVMQC